MEVANCKIWLNKGTCVQGLRVTPAEVVVLRALHQVNVGRDPVTDLVVLGRVDRSDASEMRRLREKYTARTKDGKQSMVNELYPGASPSLPALFTGIWPLDGAKVEKVAVPSEPAKYDEPVIAEPVTA